ncbi:EamA-like transporter family protein, partial [Haemophilus influenzae]
FFPPALFKTPPRQYHYSFCFHWRGFL